jgi:phenylalanyl-tRNA synthetase beta subunit
LFYRDNEKTLTDAQVNTDMQKLLDKLAKELGFVLR